MFSVLWEDVGYFLGHNTEVICELAWGALQFYNIIIRGIETLSKVARLVGVVCSNDAGCINFR